MLKNRAIIVAGPTASGKTSLAVKIAEKLHGEILSADSRQIYRGMDLGTGKDLFEYGSVPYHLIDIADPEEIYTLFHYQRDCYSALSDCFSRNVTPIICGGTGLYIEAVLNKYKLANVPEDVEYRNFQQEIDKEILIEKLKNEAPDLFEETDCSSKKRVIRALEIAEYRKENEVRYSSDNAVDVDPVILITEWDVEELKKRITLRMEQRFDEGMVQEVEALRNAGVSDERLDLFGMEYRAINKHLTGEFTKQEMYDSLQQEIFRLAKRQRTWFRGMERRGFTVHTVPNASIEHALETLRNEGFSL